MAIVSFMAHRKGMFFVKFSKDIGVTQEIRMGIPAYASDSVNEIRN